MRTFVVSVLLVSAIAAGANAGVKNYQKRGVLGHHGYASGLDVSHGVGSGVVLGGHGLGLSSKYLPPGPSVGVFSKHSSAYSVPAPTYGVPVSAPSYSGHVPAPTYGVPSLSVAAAPVSHFSVPAPTYGVPSLGVAAHASVPSFSLPAPTYGVPAPIHAPVHTPVYASAAAVPSLSVAHPVSVGSSYSSSLALGSAGVHTSSYKVPSTVVETVPSAEVSFGSASLPSKSYGVPSAVAADGQYSAGLSLSALSVPSKSYGAPVAVSHAGGYSSDLSLGSASLPSSSYGVPYAETQVGHGDGYSYPVPSKKLLD